MRNLILLVASLYFLQGCGFRGMNKQQAQAESLRLQQESEARAKHKSKEKSSRELAMELPELVAKAPPPPSPPGLLDSQKRTCSDLGFKIGTKDFGNCVMELMD